MMWCWQAQDVPGWDLDAPGEQGCHDHILLELESNLHLIEAWGGWTAGQRRRRQAFSPITNTVVLRGFNIRSAEENGAKCTRYYGRLTEPGRATGIVRSPSQPRRQVGLQRQRPLGRGPLPAPKAGHVRVREECYTQRFEIVVMSRLEKRAVSWNLRLGVAHHVGRYHNGEVTGSHFVLFTVCSHQVQELK